MIAIIYATYLEAKPLLGLLKADKGSKDKLPQYFEIAGKELLICVSGMGFKPADKAIKGLLDKYGPEQVINIGICGGLSEKVRIGGIYQVNESMVLPDVKNIYLSSALLPVNLFPQVSLISSKKPVFDLKTKEKLNEYADIVDMEGALIAKKCNEYKIPCSLIKGVSDLADTDNNKILMQNIGKVSSALAKAIYGLIK